MKVCDENTMSSTDRTTPALLLPKAASTGCLVTVWSNDQGMDAIRSRGTLLTPGFGDFSRGQIFEARELQDGEDEKSLAAVEIQSKDGTIKSGTWSERAHFDFDAKLWRCPDQGELIKEGVLQGWHRVLNCCHPQLRTKHVRCVTLSIKDDPDYRYYRVTVHGEAPSVPKDLKVESAVDRAIEWDDSDQCRSHFGVVFRELVGDHWMNMFGYGYF